MIILMLIEFLLAVGGDNLEAKCDDTIMVCKASCNKKAEYYDNEKGIWIEVEELPTVWSFNSY